MATQLAEPVEMEQPDEQGGPEINYEAEALKMGWRPPEEFKGDPAKAIDAKTFYERGKDVLPILKAQNKALEQRLAKMERTAKQAQEFFSKSEQRAYERAVSDVRAEMEAAVESGDIAAHRAASAKLDKIDKPEAPKEVDQADRAEEFADWAKANQWYADNVALQTYADAQADKIGRTKGGMLDRADLDAVAAAVKAKFEDVYPEKFGAAPKPKPRNPVDGGGQATRAPRGGHTFNDLPPEAQRQADRFIKQGYIKDRAAYVKDYQF